MQLCVLQPPLNQINGPAVAPSYRVICGWAIIAKAEKNIGLSKNHYKFRSELRVVEGMVVRCFTKMCSALYISALLSMVQFSNLEFIAVMCIVAP